MSTERIPVTLHLYDDTLEPDDWQDAAEPFRSGLSDLGAQLVRPRTGQRAPHGAKGDPLTLSLVAALVASPVLSEVVRLAAGWVGRAQHRSVELTGPSGSLTVTGHPKEEERALIAEWLRNNASSGTGDDETSGTHGDPAS
ncbi:hypothetical protein ACWEWK_09330 [Streptomyces sp. NPDC003757]